MILSIQYLRGLAALLVLASHSYWKLVQYSGIQNIDFYKIGHMGVDIFFIISGYIMCHSIKNKRIRGLSFFRKRIFRIIPLYWSLTLVALLVFLVFPNMVNSSSGKTVIFESFFLLPTSYNYLLTNGWTLAYEFYFYTIFALVLHRRNNLVLVILLISVITISGMILTKTNNAYYKFFTNEIMLEFVFGILIFKFKGILKFKPVFSCLIVLLGVLLAVYFKLNGFGIRIIDFGVPAMIFFIGVVSLEDFFVGKRHMEVSKLFEMLGASSYSLYLIHPFLLVSTALVFKWLGLTNYVILLYISLFMSSVIGGYVCYKFIEQPLSSLVWKIRTRGSLKLKKE